MAMELSELKTIVKCCAQEKGGAIRIVQLEAEFNRNVGGCLKSEASRLQFYSVAAMIKSWPDFEVSGIGLATTVQVKKVDHIFEMNRRSKNSGGKRRARGFKPLYESKEARRPLIGKDPYAFSSDTQSEHSSGEWDLVPQYPAIDRPSSSSINNANRDEKSSLKLAVKEIPPSLPIENIKELKKIVLLDHQSPHRFWFAEHEDSRKLSEMMKKMTEVYEKQGDHLIIAKKDVHVDQFVASKFYSLWHRARVVKIMAEHFRIFYVDYGTAEDVKIGNVRYLLEEFAALPAVALRGVLSHVQPTDGQWSDESKEFFFNNLFQKKIDTKILKRNEAKNCYFVAMKLTQEPDHKKRLLTELMIERNFCFLDSQFLTRENYTNEPDFEFYEAGNHLKDPQEEEKEAENWLPAAIEEEKQESWLPGAILQAEVPPKLPSKPSEASAKTFGSFGTQFSFSKLAEIRSKAAPKIHHVIEKSPSSNKKAAEVTASRIVEQSLESFEVGSKCKIYVNSVIDNRSFFFFLEDELKEILSFLDSFDEICGNNLVPCKDFAVGAEVSTFEDENYCRGRTVDHDEDKNLYKIFLVDFGTTVDRTEMELFKLSDRFKTRQPAVYKGFLANLPEHVYIKTKEDLIERVASKLTNARVVRAGSDAVDLLLLE